MLTSDYFVTVTHLLLWNGHFLKCSGHPVDLPMPFSPVHNALKFSAVLGSLSLNNSKTILPTTNRNVFNVQKINKIRTSQTKGWEVHIIPYTEVVTKTCYISSILMRIYHNFRKYNFFLILHFKLWRTARTYI